MNAFSSSCVRSFRAAEQQCLGMRVFISKYELRMLKIKEQQFHDRENTLLYSRKHSCDITKLYGIKLK
jgi:hypothetical protein